MNGDGANVPYALHLPCAHIGATHKGKGSEAGISDMRAVADVNVAWPTSDERADATGESSIGDFSIIFREVEVVKKLATFLEHLGPLCRYPSRTHEMMQLEVGEDGGENVGR